MSLEPNTKWLIFGICGWLGMIVVVSAICWGLYSIADYVLRSL